MYGNWALNQAVHFEFDGYQISYTNPLQDSQIYFATNECGANIKGVSDLVLWGQVSHSGPNLAVKVSYYNPLSYSGTFGFRDLRMLFSNNSASSTPQAKWFSNSLWSSGGISGTPCNSRGKYQNAT